MGQFSVTLLTAAGSVLTNIQQVFDNLHHARNLVAVWRNDFNHHRPHSSLAAQTPAKCADRSTEDRSLNRANL